MSRRRLIAAAVACIAFGASGVGARAVVAPDSPGCLVRTAPPKIGISELSRANVTARLLDLRVHSEAMQGTQPVYVLLPSNYDASGATRYPVLYLLHGALDDYTSYPRNGIEQIVGDLPLIVVMPDDGKDGSYSDWYGMTPGLGGPIPSWETYHTKELIPFIDSAFPTSADVSGRFVAGLSSGGGGTMKYVAANPGLFGAAGAFSGAVNTDQDYPFYPIVSEALWGVTLIPGYQPPGFCTWGDPFTQRVNWLDNTATYLAENLKGIPLFLACGDGSPGPYDGPNSGTDFVEYEVWAMNQSFVTALGAAGIPHTDQVTTPGPTGSATFIGSWIGSRPSSAPRSRRPQSSRSAPRARISRRGDGRSTPRTTSGSSSTSPAFP